MGALASPGGGNGPSIREPVIADARLTDFQFLMSHNSYHLLDDNYPTLYGYEHAPIEEQLDFKLTALELDVFPCEGTVNECQDASNYPVRHVTSFDDNSSCETLKACLDIMSTHAYQCMSPPFPPPFPSKSRKLEHPRKKGEKH